jgi:dipeptidyl aminopeptidase/acylaminoacyl peptidase
MPSSLTRMRAPGDSDLKLATMAAVAVLGLAALAHAAPQPTLEPESRTIQASESLEWSVPLTIQNNLAGGLYLDSLIVDTEVLGPLDPGAPRTSHVDMTPIAQSVGAVSAGEAASFDFQTPASAESALVVFRLYGHDAKKTQYAMRTEVTAGAGPFSLEHPSHFARAGARRVEFVILAPPPSAFSASGGPPTPTAPAVMLVHGHGASARPMMRAARILASRGFWVALPSQPGYGRSDGPADFMGPATIAALGAVLDSLAATPGVDRARLGVWGISRGATAAALLAARRSDVRAIVLQSGVYDLQATYRDAKLPGFRESIVAEAGRDSAAWRERSPLSNAANIHAATLVLHGEKDDRAPTAPAHAFAAALEKAGTPIESHFVAEGGHVLSPALTNKTALDFLARRLAP